MNHLLPVVGENSWRRRKILRRPRDLRSNSIVHSMWRRIICLRWDRRDWRHHKCYWEWCGSSWTFQAATTTMVFRYASVWRSREKFFPLCVNWRHHSFVSREAHLSCCLCLVIVEYDEETSYQIDGGTPRYRKCCGSTVSIVHAHEPL